MMYRNSAYYDRMGMTGTMLLVIVFLVPSLCLGETAVEIIPGVTHYGGHSTSVEIIPGHKQYYGEIKGSATEITPGIQHYHLERSTNTQGENHVLPYPPASSRVLRDNSDWLAHEPK